MTEEFSVYNLFLCELPRRGEKTFLRIPDPHKVDDTKRMLINCFISLNPDQGYLR